jgi:hypothetical protein
MPGRTLMEAFEQKVNAVLNKARDDAGEPRQAAQAWVSISWYLWQQVCSKGEACSESGS